MLVLGATRVPAGHESCSAPPPRVYHPSVLPLLILHVLVGGLLVWVGAELLVRGSSRLAVRLGLPPMLIGATIVAFGTSAPEAVVSLTAHVQDRAGMSFGNILGSNVCNIGLVLGITAFLLPMRVREQTLRRELPLVIVAQLLVVLLALNGTVSLVDGVVMLAVFFGVYGYLTLDGLRLRGQPTSEAAPTEQGHAARNVMFTVGGLALLIFGANVFVDGAAGIATRLGMSETLVGATIAAFGTSLPELATVLLAALRGQLEISLGTLLGSNLFNALLIGGSLATMGDVPTGAEELWHAWWMVGVTALIWPLSRIGRLFEPGRGSHINRLGGLALTAAYVAYLVGSFVSE